MASNAQSALGKFPAKIAGKHRWIAVAAHTLTDQQVAAAYGGARVNLDHTNRISFPNLGCVDCELDFEAAKSTSCPAPAAPEFASSTLDE